MLFVSNLDFCYVLVNIVERTAHLMKQSLLLMTLFTELINCRTNLELHD
jgi:hypothetical protein